MSWLYWAWRTHKYILCLDKKVKILCDEWVDDDHGTALRFSLPTGSVSERPNPLWKCIILALCLFLVVRKFLGGDAGGHTRPKSALGQWPIHFELMRTHRNSLCRRAASFALVVLLLDIYLSFMHSVVTESLLNLPNWRIWLWSCVGQECEF